MVIFHFTFDLVLFGFLPADTMRTGFWPNFARVIAGSFLFIAGISLWLAHSKGIRWRPFLRRLAVLALAAAAISAATYAAMPARFIQFGILHCIAVSSVAALLFLRLPVWVGFLSAAGVLVLPFVWRSPVFDAPWLVWTGLSQTWPPSVDYVPVFPWFAPVLLGVLAARIVGARRRSMPAAPSSRPLPALLGPLAWAGRHSLWVYLLHQPILIGLVWGARELVRLIT